MGRALLLNASFEPLCVVSVRRAVILVLKEKAEVVERDGELHSERITVPVPSVLRLVRFVHVPYRSQVPLSRRAVFVRDGYRCQYCGDRAENIDHVVPRSRGGEHTWDNVVAACRACNTRKEDRLVIEAGLRLRRTPRIPHTSLWLVANGGTVRADWGPYLPALAEADAVPA